MRYAALATLLALGATSPSWAAGTESAAYEPVDSIHHFGRIDSWRAIDHDTLIVWTTPARPYLIELQRRSPDLRNVEVIGMTSTVGTTYAKLDSIRVRGLTYPIEAIYKLSREQARNYGNTGA